MNTDAKQRQEAERQQRVESIRDAAIVRQHLGQAARHRLLPDGEHEVVLRGRVYVGATLDKVIRQAQEALA